MKKYTDEEVKLIAYNWLLKTYRESGVPKKVLEGELEEVSSLFLADPEPKVPDASERLGIIEQMILSEGTAMQAEVLKQMRELNAKTAEMEALHREWEKVIGEQLVLQNWYQNLANTTIRSTVRDILNGEIMVWVEDVGYNDLNGFFTTRKVDLDGIDPEEFWCGYIQSLIVDIETGIYHQ